MVAKEYSKYLVKIPIETHKRAKASAAMRGLSLEKVLVEAIVEKFKK